MTYGKNLLMILPRQKDFKLKPTIEYDRENLSKGQYLPDTELAILIQNHKVNKIEWINTSPEFLEKLDEIISETISFDGYSSEFLGQLKVIMNREITIEDFSQEFSNQLSNILNKLFQDFLTKAQDLINDNKVVVFKRNEYINVDLTDKNNIEFVK